LIPLSFTETINYLRHEGYFGRHICVVTFNVRSELVCYAVTSYSSQGSTASRVLAHIDTDSSHSLINNRLAYVSISRASDNARIYTDSADNIGEPIG
jgi:ATP-dependent exoDNAse (exonuclease V) alpha subunit